LLLQVNHLDMAILTIVTTGKSSTNDHLNIVQP
jgi:hypothetical protein